MTIATVKTKAKGERVSLKGLIHKVNENRMKVVHLLIFIFFYNFQLSDLKDHKYLVLMNISSIVYAYVHSSISLNLICLFKSIWPFITESLWKEYMADSE